MIACLFSPCNPESRFRISVPWIEDIEEQMDKEWRHLLTCDGGDVSIISKCELLEFYLFIFFHFWDLWVYERGRNCSPHWSDLRPLTISDSEGEVIILGSHSEKLHLFHLLYGHESLIICNPWWDKPAQQLKQLLGFFFLLFLEMFFHKEVLLFYFLLHFCGIYGSSVSVYMPPKQLLYSHRNAKVNESKAKTSRLVLNY